MTPTNELVHAGPRVAIMASDTSRKPSMVAWYESLLLNHLELVNGNRQYYRKVCRYFKVDLLSRSGLFSPCLVDFDPPASPYDEPVTTRQQRYATLSAVGCCMMMRDPDLSRDQAAFVENQRNELLQLTEDIKSNARLAAYQEKFLEDCSHRRYDDWKMQLLETVDLVRG
ncbi:uncharacterized protein K460DRAFT_363737 [Cucurbitaria berberidis CBS 394.84]|uniref:Uncharacterized protein n=1 Tax=Cucurbitaria berberidis CBS 394.84 TaxID=1168544 RepID=A0A9P4GMC2_9PLEO|nr:uncharacterized protein K460DRAFT_363737 [Cucurbitaria berberidis CBS 394.84]KAF1847691.1 hypothetical protein K460DRAFT_363737 [Cucurbitaria berberidis CBS 394.84]